jgi:hypothetical protein
MMMRAFFSQAPSHAIADSPIPSTKSPVLYFRTEEDIFTGYLSDISSDADDQAVDGDDERDPIEIPPSKRVRHKLDIPSRTARILAREARQLELRKGLESIQKLINSKRTKFAVGCNGLQAYRARAVQSYLHMVVENKRHAIEASERAAESQGFAAKWGGRLVRRWAQEWLQNRTLPSSRKGRHKKGFSLLDDANICAELRSYLRSNKWSMDPEKLAAFSQNTMVPAVADKYLRNIITSEMPRGLKKYMDVELFPRIHLKVGRGISLRTARRWLHREGFRYTQHKKALYYDGHDRPDVLQYRQDVFLPQMKKFRERLVEYEVGNVAAELDKQPPNFVERRLVLCAHDEMTAQANDDTSMSWVYEGEHALKKKGVGRGMHQSDIICSTVGWLPDASQQLEYGKNYDGYWNGEMFVKQVCLWALFSFAIMIYWSRSLLRKLFLP